MHPHNPAVAKAGITHAVDIHHLAGIQRAGFVERIVGLDSEAVLRDIDGLGGLLKFHTGRLGKQSDPHPLWPSFRPAWLCVRPGSHG